MASCCTNVAVGTQSGLQRVYVSSVPEIVGMASHFTCHVLLSALLQLYAGPCCLGAMSRLLLICLLWTLVNAEVVMSMRQIVSVGWEVRTGGSEEALTTSMRARNTAIPTCYSEVQSSSS